MSCDPIGVKREWLREPLRQAEVWHQARASPGGAREKQEVVMGPLPCTINPPLHGNVLVLHLQSAKYTVY